MLENTVEEMSTTFVGLSDSVLGSEHIRSHPLLITSVAESVKRALTLAENATRSPDAETEAVDDDREGSQGQSRALVQSRGASAVPDLWRQGDLSTAARFLTMNEMGLQDFYKDPPFDAVASADRVVQRRQPVPKNIRRMFTQNTFFTKEFWGGDYTTPADLHLVERPNRPLPFWERLLRLNLTSVIHRLTDDGTRGDTNFCTRWEARGFKYSLRHKSKANLLARTRWVIDTIAAMDTRVDSMETGMIGPIRAQEDWRPRIEAYFDNDDLRAFGAATIHSMVLAGFPVENLVNAEEVESYLKEKGMVEVSDSEMQMELTFPIQSTWAAQLDAEPSVDGDIAKTTANTGTQPRRSRRSPRSKTLSSRQSRPQKRMVTISSPTLVEKFIDLSICTGNGIGYPKPSMNAAIVAAVVRIGD